MARRFFALILLAVVACGSPEPAGRTGPETPAKPYSPPFSSDGSNPVVVFKTNKGDFKVEFFPDKAPVTVKNFLGYVDSKHYDGLVFHRVMDDFMIQGGGFKKGMAEAADPRAVERLKKQRDGEGIKNESANGLSNLRGSIA